MKCSIYLKVEEEPISVAHPMDYYEITKVALASSTSSLAKTAN